MKTIRLVVIVSLGVMIAMVGCSKKVHQAPAAAPTPILGMPESNTSMGEAEKEVMELRSAVHKNPSNVQMRQLLALTLYRIQDVRGGIREMLVASKLAPQDPRLPYLLGRMYEEDEQNEAALEAYRTAVRLAANSPLDTEWRPIYSYSLAHMLAKKGDSVQAERRYELALAQLSAYAPEWICSMDRLAETGSLGDHLRSSIEKELSQVRSGLSCKRPSLSKIQAQLSPVEVPEPVPNAVRSEELLTLESRVRAGEVIGSGAHLALGGQYMKIREVDEAVVQFLAAIELNPRGHMAWYQLGWAYLGQRRLEDAANAFGRAADLGDSGADQLATRVRQASKKLQ